MADKKIKIIKNGPYIVSGAIPLIKDCIKADEAGDSVKWEKKVSYADVGDKYSLCRCGHSEDKPFCDGEHVKKNFIGEETASTAPDDFKKSAKVYIGEDLILHDNEKLCAVARFCDVADGVWDYAKKSGDPKCKNIAIDMADACPSGRLVVCEKDKSPLEKPLPQEISIVQDEPRNCKGPIWVKGGIEIESANGESYEIRKRITLCRCGESTNMPFCDASHLKCTHMKGLDK